MENTGEIKKERIAKVMARAGLCSRRDAEAWIAAGRVKVNGEKLQTPACTVGPEDSVEVDGKPLPTAEETRLFIYHKPSGLVTTARDEKKRPTVYDQMPHGLPRVVTVGRLDMNTEGLLLLTNDGELARWLELPATGWKRHYRVRAHGSITQEKLDTLKKGIKVKGVQYAPADAVLEKPQGSNVWLTITLTEGKNREVRNLMEALGLQVNRLIRTSYGPFELGALPKGAAQEVKKAQMKKYLGAFFKAQEKK